MCHDPHRMTSECTHYLSLVKKHTVHKSRNRYTKVGTLIVQLFIYN